MKKSLLFVGCMLSNSMLMCSDTLKERIYPLEPVYKNVRPKIDGVLKDGKHEDLGDGCSLHTTPTQDLCVAVRQEGNKVTAAHILMLLRDKKQAVMVGTTYCDRLDGTRHVKNYNFLASIAKKMVRQGFKPHFDCGRVSPDTDTIFQQTGFAKFSPDPAFVGKKYELLSGAAYCQQADCWELVPCRRQHINRVAYCTHAGCWQQVPCAQHK